MRYRYVEHNAILGMLYGGLGLIVMLLLTFFPDLIK